MNTLIHCIIFNIPPQTQDIARQKLEFGYKEGKTATKKGRQLQRLKSLDLSTKAQWLGSDLRSEAQ